MHFCADKYSDVSGSWCILDAFCQPVWQVACRLTTQCLCIGNCLTMTMPFKRSSTFLIFKTIILGFHFSVLMVYSLLCVSTGTKNAFPDMEVTHKQ